MVENDGWNIRYKLFSVGTGSYGYLQLHEGEGVNGWEGGRKGETWRHGLSSLNVLSSWPTLTGSYAKVFTVGVFSLATCISQIMLNGHPLVLGHSQPKKKITQSWGS